MKRIWQTSQRELDYSKKTLVMAILNFTPDSFSDGGKYDNFENALKQAEKLISEGADILDIGGESTRPKSERVSVEEEIKRVCPIIEAIKKHCPIPISIDTSKSEVAEKAFEAGAEIINDISGLRFDENIAEISAKYKIGLVLMHLRGDYQTMHKQKPVENILQEVTRGFNWSIGKARDFGVQDNQICLDIGIGFSKTFEQNLELIAKLDKLCGEFPEFPMLVGTSRKSFIGKILEEDDVEKRLIGTLASNVISVWNGANIVRVHDVKAAVESLKVVDAIKKEL
ncbi:MAG: dihydropteroate synthase [Acidobacteriota bacterium]|jgi:dihydropteroate synthase|nr:dihydropteroate synthase [Acidobacteriota bacterium]